MRKYYAAILQGILITLISTIIIGGVMFYTDHQIQKKEFELYKKSTSEKFKSNDYLLQDFRQALDSKNGATNSRIDDLKDENTEEHKLLVDGFRALKFVVIDDNKELKDKLDLLLDNKNFGYNNETNLVDEIKQK